jgi:hypothetical protein
MWKRLMKETQKVDFRDDVFQWKAPLMKTCANTKKNNVLVALFGK